MVVNFVSLILVSSFIYVGSVEIDLYVKFLDIENIVKQQGRRIKELEGTVENLKETVSDQQTKIDEFNNIIQKFETNIGSFRSEANNNTNRNAPEDKTELIQSEDEMSQDINDRARRLLVANVPVQSSTVAFYSYLGQNEVNLATHHHLIFDVVITNFGNGYNKYTGVFSAPVSGVYVLTLTIFPNRGTITAVNILRNNDVVGEIFGDMSTGHDLSGSTCVAVVTMNKGDAATVRTSSIHQSTGAILSDANMKTSFAGWKIGDI